VALPARDGAPAGRADLAEPLYLAPRRSGELVRYQPLRATLPSALGADGGAGTQVLWRLSGTRALRSAEVVPYSASMSPDPFASPTRRPGNLERFPFVALEAAARSAEIRPGRWVVEKDLIVPPGLVLRAGPGTRLDLRRGARILSRSPLEWRGRADAPIEVSSSDGSSRGLTVLQAAGTSLLEHVRFSRLRAPDEPGSALTGAVTFYESPLELTAAEFAGNRAEDALNVIRATARIDGATFRDAPSDAFDCDFCDVEITNSRFANLGNDAIDVSGSTARVDNLVVEGAGDKGISTGEASDLVASRVLVVGANVGLASKDRSRLLARDVTLRGCNYAVAAFQKKPEFGPSEVRIEGFHTEAMPVHHLVQRGSSVTIDGQELAPSDEQTIREILYGEPGRVAAQP
jgi:hypothetical protein